MKRIGQLVFVGAVAVALALYWATAPEGLPWNRSTHLALAYLGEIVRLPVMLHPVWGCYVQVFGGAVALSVVMAALAAGLIAVLVNRYFGWRFAAGVSLVWIFLPGVWNRAITGERVICLAAMAVIAAWVLDGVARRVLRKAREVWAARKSVPNVAGGDVLGAPTVHDEAVKRGKVNRIAGWVAMGAAGLFAVVSLTLHDYRYGEAASVFAKGVVEEAEERVIVLNGVCDDQVVREVGGQRSEVRQRNSATCAAEPLNDATGVRALPAGQSVDATSSSRQNKDVSSSARRDGDVASTKERNHRSSTSHFDFRTVSLRSDDAYRTNLLAWVRSAFPTETNLWVVAQVGPVGFAEAVSRKHPDRFYLMNGKSTTLEGWERRWEAFKPYLVSRDPFVPVARRMFGYEGNSIANAMLEKVKGSGEGEQRNLASGARSALTSDQETASPLSGQHGAAGVRALPQRDESGAKRHGHCSPSPNLFTSSTAWCLYKRIYNEVDPGNLSALVNMSEMIRRGYAANGDEKKKVQEALEKFFKDAFNRKHAREIVRAAGPIRADPALVERMAEEAKRRIAAKIAAGEKIEYSPEFLSLVEWNNEMVKLMDKGELVQAGRIARAILSNPKWQGFVPANAVMGSVAASEGDFMSSAAFFKVATDTTNDVPAVVLNDYADTLVRLGRLDEAENLVRRAVKESDESFWVARLTLAEVLEKKVKVGGQGQEGKVDEAALAAFAVGGGEKLKLGVEVEERNLASGATSSLTGGQGTARPTAGQHNKNADIHSPTPTLNANSAETEIRALLKSVLKHAPAKVCDKIRKEHKGYVR